MLYILIMNDGRTQRGMGQETIFRVVASVEDLQRALVDRGIVFIEEQGMPYEVDRDAHDVTAIHVLGQGLLTEKLQNSKPRK